MGVKVVQLEFLQVRAPAKIGGKTALQVVPSALAYPTQPMRALI